MNITARPKSKFIYNFFSIVYELCRKYKFFSLENLLKKHEKTTVSCQFFMTIFEGEKCTNRWASKLLFTGFQPLLVPSQSLSDFFSIFAPKIIWCFMKFPVTILLLSSSHFQYYSLFPTHFGLTSLDARTCKGAFPLLLQTVAKERRYY